MRNVSQRRQFLKATVAVAASSVAAGRSFAAANSTLRTAHIGVGGMGASDLASIASHPQVEVAALCDVDSVRLNKAHADHPRAKTFQDFREMITSLENTVDAIVVSTPDHTHAPAAMTALRHNKPVYCQKPLTHEAHEARQLRMVAEQKQLPTQMGIQVHASATYRRAVAMIQSGVIGKVSRVIAWSSKNWGYDGGPLDSQAAVPSHLNWDLWLGTAAERPFHPVAYHPGQWRKLLDFGTGTLGDMGVHIFDTPYAALELTYPLWAKTTCRPPTGIGHPEQNTVDYEFPRTKYTTESLRWTWHDGENAWKHVSHPQLPQGIELPRQGSLFAGEEGVLLLPHISEARLFPEQKFRDYQPPAVAGGNHYHEWVDACLGVGEPSANFSYAGPLTEALLLGVVANRFPNKKLMWDANAMKVKNVAEANALLKRDYRAGFEVEGLG